MKIGAQKTEFQGALGAGDPEKSICLKQIYNFFWTGILRKNEILTTHEFLNDNG